VEFFAEIKNNSIDKDRLKNILSIARLPELCHSIDTVIRDDKDSGVITCDEHNNDIIIHLAMNKKNHDDEFIETIENFVTGWQIN